MMKDKTWIAPIIYGTLIPWTYDAFDDPERVDYVIPEVIKFEATIEFVGFRKGWSSGIKVIFKDRDRTYTTNHGETKNIIYGVCLSDSEEIIPKLNSGVMTGKFEVCKKGSSYGIKLSTCT